MDSRFLASNSVALTAFNVCVLFACIIVYSNLNILIMDDFSRPVSGRFLRYVLSFQSYLRFDDATLVLLPLFPYLIGMLPGIGTGAPYFRSPPKYCELL